MHLSGTTLQILESSSRGTAGHSRAGRPVTAFPTQPHGPRPLSRVRGGWRPRDHSPHAESPRCAPGGRAGRQASTGLGPLWPSVARTLPAPPGPQPGSALGPGVSPAAGWPDTRTAVTAATTARALLKGLRCCQQGLEGPGIKGADRMKENMSDYRAETAPLRHRSAHLSSSPPTRTSNQTC